MLNLFERFSAFELSTVVIINTLLSFIVTLIALFITKRYNKKFFISLFLINFLFPLFGYIFSIVITLFLRFSKTKEYLHYAQHYNLTEFFKNNFPSVKRIFGEASISNIDDKSKNKIKSLIFVSENVTKDNVPIVQNFLGDSDNEVRLYSFSVINSLKNSINEGISQAKIALEDEKDQSKKAKYAYQIASYNMDYIEANLIDKEIQNSTIDQIVEFCKQAIDYDHQLSQAYFLLAKAKLLQNREKEAKEIFDEAHKRGISRELIAPYLAQIYFKERKFAKIKTLFQNLQTYKIEQKFRTQYEIWSKI